MGCYDTIYIKCPKCKTPVDFQSKAGECWMQELRYPTDEIPKAVLADLGDQRETCRKCGTVIVPKATVTLTITTEP